MSRHCQNAVVTAKRQLLLPKGSRHCHKAVVYCQKANGFSSQLRV